MNNWSTPNGRRSSAMICFSLLPLVMGAANPEMRFMPIRQAPLSSPAGTVGDAVTPTFNTTLDCWEILVPAGGIEVELDLQAFGWGTALGSPTLGAIQGTLDSSGLDNGSGAGTALNPKGWPATPGHGAYQAKNICGAGGDGRPCNTPFDATCAGNTNGFCISNPAWVMPPCASDLSAISTPSLDYGWATAALNQACVIDDGQIKTLGGLILEVPPLATGTYVIALDPDRNNTFMTAGTGVPIVGVTFGAACITIECQSNEDCDDGLDCTTDQCNPVTSACEAVVNPGSCAIDGQCISAGTEDPAESCRTCDPNQSPTSWSPRPEGTPCGDPTVTSCDGGDTCNRNGVCLDNISANDTPCDEDGNECTADVCTSGTCAHNNRPLGTPCGDPTDTTCDRADSCNAIGECNSNVMPDQTPCPNGSFCDGAEACIVGVCQAGDPPCDPATEICDEQGDACDRLGDFDGDTAITLSDYLHWRDCETGPAGGPLAPGCDIFDFQPDGFVDLRDYARFQAVFDGL